MNKKLCNRIIRAPGRLWHRMVREPVCRALLGAHGTPVRIGKGTHGNLENVFCGNSVFIGENNLFLALNAPVRIGDHVVFGPNVTIVTGDHRIDLVGRTLDAVTEADKLPENDLPVVLEGDNWIGAGAVILKGVTVGTGAVIAAGAVVAKDVAPYTVAGGVPAKKLKDRFTPEELERHLRGLIQE